jgi:hypothetical protein
MDAEQELTFDPWVAMGIAFLSVLFVVGSRGCFQLWHVKTARPYLGRVALVVPWLSERSFVRLAAALPSIVVGTGGLLSAVIAAYLRDPQAPDTAIRAAGLAGVALFVLAIPLALAAALFRRPRFMVPPPLRTGARPSAKGGRR